MTIREYLESKREAAKPELWTTLAEALEELYAVKFTGSVVLHFSDGSAKAMDLPKSDRVRIL